MATRSFRPREPAADGSLHSNVTGLVLRVVHGASGGIEARWLRWSGADGAVLPTGAERAEVERSRADEALSRLAELEREVGRR